MMLVASVEGAAVLTVVIPLATFFLLAAWLVASARRAEQRR
jgi:hypothetical protein